MALLPCILIMEMRPQFLTAGRELSMLLRNKVTTPPKRKPKPNPKKTTKKPNPTWQANVGGIL